MEEKIETHESYGMISVSKFTGGLNTFFGSSIKHGGGISIAIYSAEVHRSLHRDWYHHHNNPIVEIDMSYNQFAEMLTANMNTSGTPCTIRSINGKLINCPEFVNKRLQFENEFKKDMKDLSDRLKKLTEDTEQILSSKTPIKVSEKQIILNQIKMLKQEIESNIPFIASQFNEQIDKTVTEAKGEIEGFYELKIRNLGIKALQNQNKIPEIE